MKVNSGMKYKSRLRSVQHFFSKESSKLNKQTTPRAPQEKGKGEERMHQAVYHEEGDGFGNDFKNAPNTTAGLLWGLGKGVE